MPARLICHLLATLIGFSVAAPVLAQEGEANAPSSASRSTEEPPTAEEVIADLPQEQQQVVEEAVEQAETPEGTTVIVVPPPEPTMRPYDPASETDQEAAGEERVRHDTPGEQLHPKGEDEMMGDHIVDRGDIKFRPGKGVEINSKDDQFQLRIRVRV